MIVVSMTRTGDDERDEMYLLWEQRAECTDSGVHTSNIPHISHQYSSSLQHSLLICKLHRYLKPLAKYHVIIDLHHA